MQSPRSQSGFTLIELLVSLSLFIIVVLALVSSLYNINNASRKVQAMRSVIDNLNFGLESMSRTIRTGSNIVCDGMTATHNCPLATGGLSNARQHISVDSTVGEARTVEYRYGAQDKNIQRCVHTVTDTCASGSDGWVAITAPEIEITKLNFYVDGADRGDTTQPSVIIMVEGVAHAGTDNTLPFSVQTYLSQRLDEQPAVVVPPTAG
jgi:type II secretory pathway pseudopilin PulG